MASEIPVLDYEEDQEENFLGPSFLQDEEYEEDDYYEEDGYYDDATEQLPAQGQEVPDGSTN